MNYYQQILGRIDIMEVEVKIKNSKLIAEFLGLPCRLRAHSWDSRLDQYYFTLNNIEYLLEELNFDLDYNLLIDVAERIEKLGYVIVVYKNHCHIENEGSFKKQGSLTYLNYHYGITKKEALYICIIQFIKWYNKKEKVVDFSDQIKEIADLLDIKNFKEIDDKIPKLKDLDTAFYIYSPESALNKKDKAVFKNIASNLWYTEKELTKEIGVEKVNKIINYYYKN